MTTTIPTRTLGRGDLAAGAIGLGCMGLSHGYGAGTPKGPSPLENALAEVIPDDLTPRDGGDGVGDRGERHRFILSVG